METLVSEIFYLSLLVHPFSANRDHCIGIFKDEKWSITVSHFTSISKRINTYNFFFCLLDKIWGIILAINVRFIDFSCKLRYFCARKVTLKWAVMI